MNDVAVNSIDDPHADSWIKLTTQAPACIVACAHGMTNPQRTTP